MRRMITAVLALCMCTMGISKALAGPGCCAKKGAEAKMTSTGCCKAGFPTMAMMVGEKSYECPVEAKKAAEAAHSKVIYVVADKKFDCPDAATVALADASEAYVNHFTMIACVVDGKVMYCGEDCDKTGKPIASASCCKSGSKASMVKAEGGSCKGSSAVAVKSEGSGCSHGSTAVAAKSEGGCTKGAKSEDHGNGGGYKSGTVVKVSADGKSEKACCMSGKNVKFMVAGRTYDKIEAAQKASDEVMAAANKVQMKFIVDGKEVDCSSKVCPVAKKEGKVVYVVADEKLKCEYAARIALAKAKYEAARGTAEKLAKI
jgi:hypothetical protein